jgi:hypothetical protein
MRPSNTDPSLVTNGHSSACNNLVILIIILMGAGCSECLSELDLGERHSLSFYHRQYSIIPRRVTRCPLRSESQGHKPHYRHRAYYGPVEAPV